MDFSEFIQKENQEYQQARKEEMKREFTRLNKWDDKEDQSEQSLSRQRMETAERIVRKEKESNREFQEAVERYELAQIPVFGVAGGAPVWEIVPARKAKCRERQETQLANEARNVVRERSEREGTRTKRLQDRVNDTSYLLQRGIEKNMENLEKNMAGHEELRGNADYEVIKYFSDRDKRLIEDYSSNDYEKRKVHLRNMTTRLMGENVTSDYFHRKNLEKSGGTLQALVRRYQLFKKVYSDPINKPYFDGLSSMEKQLIQVRILDMADLYENVFRSQCRSLGVDMDNGQYLRDDTELSERKEERKAVRNFKEKIEYRNQKTREILLADYEDKLENSQELKAAHEDKKKDIESGAMQELQGTGLTGFLPGYTVEIVQEARTLFMERPKEYEASKPLLDLMEQELFRVTDAKSEYTKRATANNIIQSGYSPATMTEAENQYSRLLVENMQNLQLKSTILQNRVNSLKDGMKAIIKGKESESESGRKVIEEFWQKLDSRNVVLQEQIDQATKNWKKRSLSAVKEKEWKAHEYYDGTQDLTDYIAYTGSFEQQKYTQQLGRLGLDKMIQKEVEQGHIREVTHSVETRAGDISGLAVNRMIHSAEVLTVLGGLSVKQAKNILCKVAAGGRQGTEEQDRLTGEGLIEYKKAIYRYLKGLEVKYGKMLTQLHPEDVLRKINFQEWGMEKSLMQDMIQLIENNKTGIQLFTEDEQDPEYTTDTEYKDLAYYYLHAFNAVDVYVHAHGTYVPDEEMLAPNNKIIMEQMTLAREKEDKIQEGPALKSSQMPYYAQSVRNRYRNSENLLKHQTFGRW